MRRRNGGSVHHRLQETGLIQFDGVSIDVTKLKSNSCVKILDFSCQPINTFKGTKVFPNVHTVDCRGTNITSLEGFGAFPNLSKLNVSNTPFSSIKNYKLSIAIAFPKISVINDKIVPRSIHEKAQSLIDENPTVTDLVLNGWIAKYPMPDEEEMNRLQKQLLKTKPENSKTIPEQGQQEQEEPKDFNEVVAPVIEKYRRMYNQFILQAKNPDDSTQITEASSLIDSSSVFSTTESSVAEEEPLQSKVAALLRRHGLHVSAADAGGILSAVRTLIGKSPATETTEVEEVGDGDEEITLEQSAIDELAKIESSSSSESEHGSEKEEEPKIEVLKEDEDVPISSSGEEEETKSDSLIKEEQKNTKVKQEEEKKEKKSSDSSSNEEEELRKEELRKGTENGEEEEELRKGVESGEEEEELRKEELRKGVESGEEEEELRKEELRKGIESGEEEEELRKEEVRKGTENGEEEELRKGTENGEEEEELRKGTENGEEEELKKGVERESSSDEGRDVIEKENDSSAVNEAEDSEGSESGAKETESLESKKEEKNSFTESEQLNKEGDEEEKKSSSPSGDELIRDENNEVSSFISNASAIDCDVEASSESSENDEEESSIKDNA